MGSTPKFRSVTQLILVPCTSGHQSPHSDMQSSSMTPQKSREIMTLLQYNRQLLILRSINQSHNQPYRLCMACYLVVVCTTCDRNNISHNKGGAIPPPVTEPARFRTYEQLTLTQATMHVFSGCGCIDSCDSRAVGGYVHKKLLSRQWQVTLMLPEHSMQN